MAYTNEQVARYKALGFTLPDQAQPSATAVKPNTAPSGNYTPEQRARYKALGFNVPGGETQSAEQAPPKKMGLMKRALGYVGDAYAAGKEKVAANKGRADEIIEEAQANTGAFGIYQKEKKREREAAKAARQGRGLTGPQDPRGEIREERPSASRLVKEHWEETDKQPMIEGSRLAKEENAWIKEKAAKYGVSKKILNHPIVTAIEGINEGLGAAVEGLSTPETIRKVGTAVAANYALPGAGPAITAAFVPGMTESSYNSTLKAWNDYDKYKEAKTPEAKAEALKALASSGTQAVTALGATSLLLKNTTGGLKAAQARAAAKGASRNAWKAEYARKGGYKGPKQVEGKVAPPPPPSGPMPAVRPAPPPSPVPVSPIVQPRAAHPAAVNTPQTIPLPSEMNPAAPIPLRSEMAIPIPKQTATTPAIPLSKQMTPTQVPIRLPVTSQPNPAIPLPAPNVSDETSAAKPLVKKATPKKGLVKPTDRVSMLSNAQEQDPTITEADLRYAAMDLSRSLADVQGKGQGRAAARSSATRLEKYAKDGKEVGPRGGVGVMNFFGDEIISKALEIKYNERWESGDLTEKDRAMPDFGAATNYAKPVAPDTDVVYNKGNEQTIPKVKQEGIAANRTEPRPFTLENLPQEAGLSPEDVDDTFLRDNIQTPAFAELIKSRGITEDDITLYVLDKIGDGASARIAGKKYGSGQSTATEYLDFLNKEIVAVREKTQPAPKTPLMKKAATPALADKINKSTAVIYKARSLMKAEGGTEYPASQLEKGEAFTMTGDKRLWKVTAESKALETKTIEDSAPVTWSNNGKLPID